MTGAAIATKNSASANRRSATAFEPSTSLRICRLMRPASRFRWPCCGAAVAKPLLASASNSARVAHQNARCWLWAGVAVAAIDASMAVTARARFASAFVSFSSRM